MPLYVTLQIAFYDDSQLSGEPKMVGFVSIALHGYIQTPDKQRHSCSCHAEVDLILTWTRREDDLLNVAWKLQDNIKLS
jgi:hypothetical protein